MLSGDNTVACLVGNECELTKYSISQYRIHSLTLKQGYAKEGWCVESYKIRFTHCVVRRSMILYEKRNARCMDGYSKCNKRIKSADRDE